MHRSKVLILLRFPSIVWVRGLHFMMMQDHADDGVIAQLLKRERHRACPVAPRAQGFAWSL